MIRKTALALVLTTAAAGAFAEGPIGKDPVSFTSSITREQATAAYVAEREAVNALHGEDSGSAYLAAQQPAPSAEPQVAEAAKTPE